MLFAASSMANVYLSDRMSNKMLQQYIGGAPSMIQSRIASLSDRELEVFRLIGEGRATREIAEELHLSIKTVETYQAHIKEKLALRSGTRTDPARDSVEDQRNQRLIRFSTPPAHRLESLVTIFVTSSNRGIPYPSLAKSTRRE